MKNLALPRIQSLSSYDPPPGERQQDRGLFLDFNERVPGPSPRVRQALADYALQGSLQRYPDYGALEQKIAKYCSCEADQIMTTNGSDQAIDVVMRTFLDADSSVLIPAPSYAMYGIFAPITGARVETYTYRPDDFSFPRVDVLNKVDETTKLIILCNPNNPTGTLIPLADIEAIAKKSPQAIIFVDEAYFEFSGVTATSLISKYPNVIVARTFSKAFGLAALRIGYLIADQNCIYEMGKVRNPYDINAAAIVAADVALDETDDMKEYVRELMTEAKPLIESFFSSLLIPWFRSSANFILFQPNDKEATNQILSDNDIFVRAPSAPEVTKYLRLTIGPEKEMLKFIDVYREKVLGQQVQPGRKCAFLDRDGTLIFEPQTDYQIDSISKLKFLDGAVEGLQKVRDEGYSLILITNQDDLGTSKYPFASFASVQTAFAEQLAEQGIQFDEILVCPHVETDSCPCRKPGIGLVETISRFKDCDQTSSFVCGDRSTDRALAEHLGITFAPATTNGNFLSAINSSEL